MSLEMWEFFNQLLPSRIFKTKVTVKTAQVLKITSAWSLLIQQDRKLCIEVKVNSEAQCNLKLVSVLLLDLMSGRTLKDEKQNSESNYLLMYYIQ